MKWSIVVGLLSLTCGAACLSVDEPPTVASRPTSAGSSSPGMSPSSPCPATSLDAGNFNFDAQPDIGLGIGTTNPTTPPEGGTAFSGDATVAPAVDAGTTSPCL